jgi:hypothetical protein
MEISESSDSKQSIKVRTVDKRFLLKINKETLFS